MPTMPPIGGPLHVRDIFRDGFEPSEDALKKIPQAIAVRLQVIPLHASGRRLTVAAVDPEAAAAALRAERRFRRLKLEFVRVDEVAMAMAIERLYMVVAQRLIRRICFQCRARQVPIPSAMARLPLPPEHADLVPMKGKGCRECSGQGISGRIGLFERLEVDEAMAEALRGHPTAPALYRAAGERMARTLNDEALRAFVEGWITAEEALRAIGR